MCKNTYVCCESALLCVHAWHQCRLDDFDMRPMSRNVLPGEKTAGLIMHSIYTGSCGVLLLCLMQYGLQLRCAVYTATPQCAVDAIATLLGVLTLGLHPASVAAHFWCAASSAAVRLAALAFSWAMRASTCACLRCSFLKCAESCTQAKHFSVATQPMKRCQVIKLGLSTV